MSFFETYTPVFMFLILGSILGCMIFIFYLLSSALKVIAENGVHVYHETNVNLPQEFRTLAKTLDDAATISKENGVPVRMINNSL